MTKRVKKTFKKKFHVEPENNQEDLIAHLILKEFDEFYVRYKEITESAKEAFESCNFQDSQFRD